MKKRVDINLLPKWYKREMAAQRRMNAAIAVMFILFVSLVAAGWSARIADSFMETELGVLMRRSTDAKYEESEAAAAEARSLENRLNALVRMSERAGPLSPRTYQSVVSVMEAAPANMEIVGLFIDGDEAVFYLSAESGRVSDLDGMIESLYAEQGLELSVRDAGRSGSGALEAAVSMRLENAGAEE